VSEEGPTTPASARKVLFGIDPLRVVVPLFIAMVSVYVVLLLLDYWLILSRDVDPFQNRFFNLAGEDNLATYVGINQALLVALTAWETRSAVVHRKGSSLRRVGWSMVSLFLLWLVLDDALTIHERVGGLFGPVARDIGFPGYTWHLLVPLYGVATLATLAFLWKDFGPGSSRWLLLVTLMCFVAAVALDFVEALNLDHPWNPHRAIAERFEMESFTTRHFRLGSYLTLKHVTMAIEEVIEMFGMTVLWIALLRNLGGISGKSVIVEGTERESIP
jgi:hypothetical protein